MVPEVENSSQRHLPLAAIWRRALAYTLDLILLCTVGSIVAAVGFDTFVRMGLWGRVIGLMIFLLYFAIFDSEIGGGQTIGDRILSVQVVDAKGRSVSFPRSFLRALIYGAPIFLNQLTLPTTQNSWIISSVVGFIFFGITFGTLYLVIFNRATRQGLHDLAAGTYVVQAASTGIPLLRPTWRLHWIILSSLYIAIAISVVLSVRQTRDLDPELLQANIAAESVPGVQATSVVSNGIRSEGTFQVQSVVIRALWNGTSTAEDTASQIVNVFLQRDPGLAKSQQLTIIMTSGANLGIASHWHSDTFTHTPQAWQDIYPNDPEPAAQ